MPAACTGAALMGSLQQQPLWNKLQNQLYPTHGFLPQLKFNANFKPCKVSHVEGAILTAPQIGGNPYLPLVHLLFTVDMLWGFVTL